MSFPRVISGLLILAALGGLGCSNDEDGPTAPVGTNSTSRHASGKYWVTQVDASSYDQTVYYSFAGRDVVPLSKAADQAANDWDIGFKRSVIITNGGQSGSGDAMGIDLTAAGDPTGFVEVTVAKAEAIPAEDWISDGKSLVVNDYYDYNLQTHGLTMTQNVYALRDAAGQYAKLQILEILGGGAPPAMGNFVLKFVHQPLAGSIDLSGPVQVDTVDGSTGEFYYDFSAASAVTPTDPANSLDWDIKVSSYDLYLNSSFSGPGEAAANPAYALLEGMSDPTDFDFYTEAVTVPQAYAQDAEESVFSDWYDYDGQTHSLTSKGHVYLLQTSGKTYKVMIETYYGETGVSGNFILYWEEL